MRSALSINTEVQQEPSGFYYSRPSPIIVTDVSGEVFTSFSDPHYPQGTKYPATRIISELHQTPFERRFYFLQVLAVLVNDSMISKG